MYQIHVAFLGKLPRFIQLVIFLTKNKRFHHITCISALKPQTAKGILPFNLIFNAEFQKINAEIPFTTSYLEPCYPPFS